MRIGLFFFVTASLACAARAEDLTAREVSLNIPAQSLSSAILEFSAQTGVQVVADGTDVSAAKTAGVSGHLSIGNALERLLIGTGLRYQAIGKTAITLRRIEERPNEGRASADEGSARLRLAQAASRDREAAAAASETSEQLDEVALDLPEILVRGSKVLNMDVRRSRDDAQPYVIFDREVINRSSATNLEDFLKQRLTMNTIGSTNAQGASVLGNQSQINLRGLGANQTLILVDGHRTANPISFSGRVEQSDLNGIPLAAVERIEVLPTTASGIYGGSATGGVVNIVLRRDYTGFESKLTYDNSFDTDSAIRRVDASAGFALEGGKTDILLAGSYSDANVLAVQERNFQGRGRAAILVNNPGFFLNSSTPPLGATTNIRSADGSDLVLDDGTPLDSPTTHVPVGYAGPASDDGAALVLNAGEYNLASANTAQADGGGARGLLASPKVESLTATVRRQFGSRVQAFLELAAANNSSEFPSSNVFGQFTLSDSAPGNPFAQAISVTVPVAGGDGLVVANNKDRRAVGGVIVKLPHEWSVEADYTWDRYRWNFSSPTDLDVAAAGAAVEDGTLDVLRDTNAPPADVDLYLRSNNFISTLTSTLKDATLRFAGPVVSLPGGALRLVTLFEHRDERFGSGTEFSPDFPPFFYPSRSQSVDSVYVETRVPIVSAANAIPGIQELELQVAARRDDYTAKGATNATFNPSQVGRLTRKTSSTDPTIGLRYQPVRDVMLRASYGTGFLPPALNQLVPNAALLIRRGSSLGLTDPRRGNEPLGIVAFRLGGNPDLLPEQSESWSAGVVLTPHFAPGLRLSVDWTQIDKADNIISVPFIFDNTLVDNEAFLPGRIERAASCPGDPFEPVCPIVGIDTTPVNIAQARVAAYDAAIDYRLESARFGAFDFFALATWQTHFKTQLLPSAPVVENVGVTRFNPLKFKANAGMTWNFRKWTAGWTVRYFDSYVVSTSPTAIANHGSQIVPDQIYHDLFASYRLRSGGFVGTAEVQLGIDNVFNTKPPFDAANTSSFYSIFGNPRLACYNVSVKFAF